MASNQYFKTFWIIIYALAQCKNVSNNLLGQKFPYKCQNYSLLFYYIKGNKNYDKFLKIKQLITKYFESAII